MYRLVITFLLMGAMASCVNAQADSTSNHDWNVFVSPLSVLNPSYPAFHVGTEREMGEMECCGRIRSLAPEKCVPKRELFNWISRSVWKE